MNQQEHVIVKHWQTLHMICWLHLTLQLIFLKLGRKLQVLQLYFYGQWIVLSVLCTFIGSAMNTSQICGVLSYFTEYDYMETLSHTTPKFKPGCERVSGGALNRVLELSFLIDNTLYWTKISFATFSMHFTSSGWPGTSDVIA